jgi:hypothetical protein
MNKRIKELAEQNGFIHEHMTDSERHDASKKFEKITELVVKECTGLLWNESERLYAYSSECNNERHSDEAELSAEKCLDNIKILEEHFGIE